MKNQVYKFYKELPPWAKGVVVVGGSLAAFMVLRRVYKGVFPSEADKKNRKLFDNVNKEISSYQQNGQSQATVELTMKKMKNNLDVAKLIKAFGKRQDYFFGIPVGDPMDLFTYVQKELGNDYLGLTNYRVKNINEDWKKKGITYQI